MKRWLMLLVLATVAGWVLADTPESGDRIPEAVQLVQQSAGDHRLLLIGEAHGTHEIPRLVAALVDRYSADGPVLLAIEMWQDQHPRLRDYLASDGSVSARAALRGGDYWQVTDDQHDGRRNHDMLDLIEHLRQLRVQGRDVAILPIDPGRATGRDSQLRDRVMAKRLRAGYIALPRGHVLALVGNVHAMLDKPGYTPPQMQTPMGAYLHDLHPYAINVMARSGNFWACITHCGPMEVGVAPPGDSIDGGSDADTYDLLLVLPRFTVARLLVAPSQD